MADSVDPVADVVLWKGVAGRNTLRLRSIIGAAEAVASSFGEPGNAGGDRVHPLFAVEAIETTDARKRCGEWFESLFDPVDPPPPLTLRYPWPDAAGAASPNASARPWVLESIWVEDLGADPVDEHGVPVHGHLLIPRPATIELADRQTFRAGLHKVNNDLSIVSMVLDVIALKLRQPFDDAARKQLIDSADQASAAVRRSGKIISAIQHHLKH